MFVRWQRRMPRHAGPRPASSAAGQPTAADLALEARAVAFATSRPAPWRRRVRRPKRPRPAALVAVVVESQRKGGQPRQRLIQYVGSIRLDDVHLPSARREFWDRAASRLDHFVPGVRQRFEAAIASKIPRPPVEVFPVPPSSDVSRADAIQAALARMRALRAAT